LSLVITNQENSVVRSTVGAIIWRSSDDSSAVREQEICIEGDGQRSVGDEVGHDLGDISAECSPVGNLGNVGLAGLAGSILSSVWVVSLVGESTIGDDVLVCEPWESSSTSSVAEIWFGLKAAVRAIDDPLFRERNEFSLGKEPLSFNVLSSREGPARSAAGLVLDGGDCSLLAPVPCLGDGFGFNLCHSVVWPDASVVLLRIELGEEHGRSELVLGQVRVLVDSKGGLWVLSVQFGISFQVGLEVGESEVVFFSGGIDLAILCHEFGEEGFFSSNSLGIAEGEHAKCKNYEDC